MGSKSPTTNTTSSTAPDPQAYSDVDAAINKARKAANQPYQAYTGPLTAGVNSQEQGAISATNGLAAATNDYLGSAGGLAQASTAAVNPTAVNGAAISQYESPYQSDVVNATMAEIANQNKQQSEAQTSSAISAGAFGGDRAGVAQAALAGQQDLASNATLANLNNENYSQALGEANTQQATTLSADQANRAALASGSELYSGLGSLASSTGINNAEAQLQGGLLEQQTQQAQDTAAYGQFENAEAYPFQTAEFLSGIEGSLAPELGTSSAGTSVTSPPNPLNSIIGGGLGVASLLSDRRAKEDIKAIGKDFTGQMLYSFRYRGQAETHVGYIAQDIEKKHPDAVARRSDGMRVVDYAEASRKAAEKGHFARGGRTLGDLGAVRRFASGGIAGMPYSDGTGYVPAVGLAQARLPGSPMPGSAGLGAAAAPTASTVPNFSSFISAGKGLSNTGIGDSVSDFAQDSLGFARGGLAQADGSKVVNLGLARARRGYDDGGPVTDSNALMFDPNAVGDPAALAGLSAAGLPTSGFAPPPSAPPSAGAPPTATPTPRLPGLAAAGTSPQPQPGLAAADTSAPVPVAPAPNVTPVVGYRGADGTVTPAPGLGAADTSGASGATGGLGAAAMPGSDTPAPSAALGAAALPGSPTPSPGVSAAAAPDASGAINAATAPRSVRNNNPGNIEDGKYAQSLPGYAGSDGRFAKFESPEAGSAAMDGLLNRYGQQGLVTPLQIISKWSPAGDGANNPTAYASTVAKTLGIGVNDPINMNDPTQRAALGKAMASVEAGTGSGGLPKNALGYADSAESAGLGVASTGGPSSPGLAAAALPASRFSDNFGSMIGGTGTPTADHSGGLLGLFPSLSDGQRLGLAAAGFGMAASGSRSVGQALGQGGLQGLQTYQAQQKLLNDQRTIALKAQELSANLKRIAQEGKNYESEDVYRRGSVANETARINTERYEVIPGPDGSFRFLDKQNPGAGLMTSGQMSPASPAPASSLPPAGGPAPSVPQPAPVTGAPPAGAPPTTGMQTPPQLDSSNFTKTGNPTLRAPDGFLPVNYWANQYRARNDPVMRDTMAKQTVDDVTDANARARKAYSSIYYSDEMDRAAAGLPQSGPLAPGGFFNERLAIAKNFNAVMNSIPGLGDLQVSPDAIAKGENLIKDKTRLTGDLTSTLGSREAASVYASQMSAVPGADNTRAGYKAVSSAIRTLSQREIDRNAFMQDYVGRYGTTSGAEVAFNQLNPAMVYAQQAQALARIPQQATDLLRDRSNDPQTTAAFEAKYGVGTARYFTGQAAQ